MKNSNQINVPQAREAMDKFKMLICPGDGRQPEAGLQRRPDLPGIRGPERPDGQRRCVPCEQREQETAAFCRDIRRRSGT